MKRLPAAAYRLGPDTLADIDRLAEHLRTSATGVVREAVRRLALAELTASKKNKNKPPAGIANGNTRE